MYKRQVRRFSGTDAQDLQPYLMDFASYDVVSKYYSYAVQYYKNAEDEIQWLPILSLIHIYNTSVVLPKNQGKLLVALLSGGDALVTTEQLCMALWGTTEYIDENALQVNLTRLKKTMSALEMKQRIVAVRGMGYRLEAEVSL